MLGLDWPSIMELLKELERELPGDRAPRSECWPDWNLGLKPNEGNPGELADLGLSTVKEKCVHFVAQGCHQSG